MLSSATSAALSGLNAAQTTLNVSANNVANAATPNFRRDRVLANTQSNGGVSTSVTKTNAEGPALATDMVEQLAAKNASLLNLAVFKTADQMAGTILDVRA